MVRLPVFVITALMALARAGDDLGLLPRKMIDADPLFTSIFRSSGRTGGLGANSSTSPCAGRRVGSAERRRGPAGLGLLAPAPQPC